ncbi:MAG: NADH-quinone oxidoreductase subunit C, partial [Candidatus Omnitrophica bacterium]|nr:NADH-quinone oxidoreductase subunit C [Candidatus Omnitrophota bacterium]
DIKDCTKIIFKDLNARYIIASGIENFDSFEVLYHFGFDKEGTIVSIRVYLDKERPEIESLTDIIPGISYIEREMWELLGINFTGHPQLKHFLLRDDWEKENYPLRKETYEQ